MESRDHAQRQPQCGDTQGEESAKCATIPTRYLCQIKALITSACLKHSDSPNLKVGLKWVQQARTDPARREIHVESLNKYVNDLQKRTEAQDQALQGVQNEFVESRREQTRLQGELLRKEKALRDTQIRSMNEMGRMKRAQEQQVEEFSVQKFKGKPRDHSTAHFPIAANARTDDFHERFWRFSGCRIKLQWKMISRFQSICQTSEFSVGAQPRKKVVA